jgi:phage tail tape-measure protein
MALGVATAAANATKIGSMIYRYKNGGGGIKGLTSAFSSGAAKRDGQSPGTALFVVGGLGGLGGGLGGVGGVGGGGSVLDMLGPSKEHLDRRAARESRVAWGRIMQDMEQIKNLDSSTVLKGLKTGITSAGKLGASLAKLAGPGLLIGIGADIASDALKEHGHEKMGAAAGILGDAASGAAMGSLFGPIGTAIGGALGGALGLYNNWDDLFSSNDNAASGSPSQQVEKVKKEDDHMRNVHTQMVEANKLTKEHIDLAKKQIALSSNIDKNTWVTAGSAGFQDIMLT